MTQTCSTAQNTTETSSLELENKQEVVSSIKTKLEENPLISVISLLAVLIIVLFLILRFNKIKASS